MRWATLLLGRWWACLRPVRPTGRPSRWRGRDPLPRLGAIPKALSWLPGGSRNGGVRGRPCWVCSFRAETSGHVFGGVLVPPLFSRPFAYRRARGAESPFPGI